MRHSYSATLFEFYRAVPGTSSGREATVDDVLQFIACLHSWGVAAVSMCSKLSALSFWHHLNCWAKRYDNFLVRKAILGSVNMRPAFTSSKLPVSPSLLLCLIHRLPIMVLAHFKVIMFTAVFTMAFFAFLHVGEYTVPALFDLGRSHLHAICNEN